MKRTLVPWACALLAPLAVIAHAARAAEAPATPAASAQPDAKKQLTCEELKNSADVTNKKDILISCRNAELVGSFDPDVAVPDSPGFSVIGVSPTQIIDPATTPLTMASIPTFLDANGKLKPGLALAGTPYWWFARETLDEYNASGPVAKALKRATISAGYAGGDATTPERIGLGVHTELLGAADYRGDEELYKYAGRAAAGLVEATDAEVAKADAALRKRLQDKYDIANKPQNIPAFQDEYASSTLTAKQAALAVAADRLGNSYEGDLKACRDKATDRYTRRESLVVAGGVAIKSLNGQRSTDGGSVWVSYRRPFTLAFAMPADDVQNYVTLFGRYDFDKTRSITPATSTTPGTTPGTPAATPAPAAATSQMYDRAMAALVFGYETKTWKLAANAGYEADRYRGAGPYKNESFGFYGVSADYQVRDGVWVNLKAGSKNDSVARQAGKNTYLVVSLHLLPSLGL